MNTNNGGPAFPREDYQSKSAGGQTGMSLRDYFAAKAMNGMLSADGSEDSASDWSCEYNIVALAERSYKIADAMLQARG